MPPRAAQKRAAASRGEPSGSSTLPAPKKTRFVDPSEDPANFAEQVDAGLEDATARSKKRVKTEGYDSDSSDEEGESVVLSRRKNDAGAQEEEDDMFAMGDKDEKGDANGESKKKKEEYLRLGDIEGQEFGNEKGSDEEEQESDTSDEPEDEDDAERRKKAGMGYELSSFNMREEMEEGKFTEDGMYVRSVDAHAIHDRWLDDTDERGMKQARRRKRARERQERERMRAEEREAAEEGGKEAMEQELVGMLKKGETVLEALQRLGKQAKKGQSQPKGKGKKAGNDMDVDKAAKEPTAIDRITDLASKLMSNGDTDIYSRTYEELVRAVRASGKVDREWLPPSADVKYEYKWNVPDATAQEGEVFGPYGEDELMGWYKASFFGDSGEKVQVRKVGGEWGSWQDTVL